MDTNQGVRLSLGPDERHKLKVNLLLERRYSDRVSTAMALHLGLNLSSRRDYFEVLDELDFLEGQYGASRTKPATQFTDARLHGLWHKNYSCARHLPMNVALAWGLGRGGRGNSKLDSMIQDIANRLGDHPDAWKVFAYHFIDGYKYRAERPPRVKEARLTGDWIVFAKHRGQNYYLTLASHAEGASPQQLFDTIRRHCEPEFPFLFN